MPQIKCKALINILRLEILMIQKALIITLILLLCKITMEITEAYQIIRKLLMTNQEVAPKQGAQLTDI